MSKTTEQILKDENCTCHESINIIKYLEHLEDSANGNCPSITCRKLATKFCKEWDKDPEKMKQILTEKGLKDGFLFRLGTEYISQA